MEEDSKTDGTDRKLTKGTVVTYQPPALDYKRVGIVIEQHNELAGEHQILNSDRKVEFISDREGIDEDEPLYNIKQCVIVEGTVKPTESIATVPRCNLTPDERLTNELKEKVM